MKRIVLFLTTICMLVTTLSFSSCSSKELQGEDIYNLIAPSTVEITAKGTGFENIGTGFFIDTSRTLVTNYHVIEKCTEAQIKIADGGIL